MLTCPPLQEGKLHLSFQSTDRYKEESQWKKEAKMSSRQSKAPTAMHTAAATPLSASSSGRAARTTVALNSADVQRNFQPLHELQGKNTI